MKMKRIGFKEKFAVKNFIESHLKSWDGKICEYNDGWSDDRVVEEMRAVVPNITLTHVKSVRYEMYGKFFTKGARVNPDRTDRLERRVAGIDRYFFSYSQSTTKSIEKLEDLVKDLDEAYLRLSTKGG